MKGYIITTQAAVEITGNSKGTIYRLINNGTIRVVKSGRTLLLNKDDVAEIARRKRERLEEGAPEWSNPQCY